MRRPAELLASLLLQRARVYVVNGRLRVEASADVLTDDDYADLAEHKPSLLRLVALAGQYRAVVAMARYLHQAFATTPLNDLAKSTVLLDEQARLLDDLGPALAAAILAHSLGGNR